MLSPKVTNYFRDCFVHLPEIERKRIITPRNVKLRLNRGECPDPLPLEIQSEISKRLLQWVNTTQQYPNYGPFYEKLSQHSGVPGSNIVVGAGIEEFIRMLMFLCCDPGQKAAVLWPTCAMYDIYARAFDIDLIRIMPVPGEPFDLVTLIPQMPDDIKVLFVPNPGQPVETYFTPDQVEFLADYCQLHGILLVVDEAHWGFGAKSAMDIALIKPNVLVLRTFSKLYGAASIRVGYAVGQQHLIKALDAVRPSGEISGPSMVIAEALIDNYRFLIDRAFNVMSARNYLVGYLNEIPGIRGAWGKWGFSVLIEFGSTQESVRVADALAAQGVYVKVGFPPPVERHMLLACGERTTVDQFLQTFRDVYSYE